MNGTPEENPVEPIPNKPKKDVSKKTVEKHSVVIEGIKFQVKKRDRATVEVVVDPKMVYELSTMYATAQEMANFFGITLDQLNWNFKEIIKEGRAAACMSLRRAQMKKALDGDSVPMMIWLGKQILNQQEPTKQIELSTVKTDSDEELTKRLEKLIIRSSGDS